LTLVENNNVIKRKLIIKSSACNRLKQIKHRKNKKTG